jgi:Uma2 family endonuclease
MELAGYFVHSQDPITTLESEPEPDIAIIEGEEDDYLDHNPPPKKVKLVMEVSDTTLEHDRGIKKRIYARAGIPIFWVINVRKKVVEMYSQPTGPDREPRYLKCLLAQEGKVGVKIGRKLVGEIDVGELFKTRAG